jgi:hypothetical protein
MMIGLFPEIIVWMRRMGANVIKPEKQDKTAMGRFCWIGL